MGSLLAAYIPFLESHVYHVVLFNIDLNYTVRHK